MQTRKMLLKCECGEIFDVPDCYINRQTVSKTNPGHINHWSHPFMLDGHIFDVTCERCKRNWRLKPNEFFEWVTDSPKILCGICRGIIKEK
jgi:hypothetical protein